MASVMEETSIDRIYGVRVAADRLHRHPANPPERSEAQHNLELIQSIERFGQREACRVRELPEPNQFQLLSGHRRAAACRTLGIECRVEVVTCSDEEALREVMLGNAQREDLDAIQRAELLQTMIESGMDRDEAGALFGLESDSGIKNCLRLLKLPNSVRKLITEGKIPARAARYLIPYAEATVVMDAFAKSVSTDEWDLIDFVAAPDGYEFLRFDDTNADARPMSGAYKPSWEYEKTERKFEPTAAERKRLQIATVNHDGKQIEIAQNVRLFDQLQADHLVKKTGYGSPKKPNATAKPAAKKLTAAQQAAEDKRKAKAAADQLKKRLPIWAKRFQRMAMAVQTPRCSPVILCTLPWWINQARPADDWIAAAMETLGCKGGKRTRPDLIALLIGATDGTGMDVVDRLWRILVWPQHLPSWPLGPIQQSEKVTIEPPKVLAVGCEYGVTPGDIEPQMKMGGVDLALAWSRAAINGPEQMMLIEFLQLHTTAQLDSLAKGWKLTLPEGTKKAKVQAIVDSHAKKALAMPKVLK